jgi:RNA polymerase primary sigma factor
VAAAPTSSTKLSKKALESKAGNPKPGTAKTGAKKPGKGNSDEPLNDETVGGIDATAESGAEEDSDQEPGAAASPDIEIIDDEFDLSDVSPDEITGDQDSLSPPRPEGREMEEGAGDSMLARYFREMATHPVMGPDEELQTAIAVEDAEVEHWYSILASPQTASFALLSLERDLPKGEEALNLPQIGELDKLVKAFKKQRSKLTREQEKKWKGLCISLARAIRLADSDRLWILHSEDAVRRLGAGQDLDDHDEDDGPQMPDEHGIPKTN